MIGVVFRKLILRHLKSPKIARNSGVFFFVQKVFFEIEGRFWVIGVVFGKLILRDLKSPKIARNSIVIRFFNFKVFMYWRC